MLVPLRTAAICTGFMGVCIAAPLSFAQSEVLDVMTLDVASTHASLLARKFTAEDLLRAHLNRIGQFNENYNAFTSMNPKAMEDARAIDRRMAAGEPVPTLAGIPIAIKESV